MPENSPDPYSLPDDVLTVDPRIHESAFIAPGAQIISDVRIAPSASVWYNCVLRGDIQYISIGEGSNIQDGSILHVTNELPCEVAEWVTVGHHVNLHACHIETRCLIGIGAIVLSGARVGRGSVVAAGAVLRENQVVPPHSLVAGVPGKVVKKLDPKKEEENLKISQKYVALARRYREKLFKGN